MAAKVIFHILKITLAYGRSASREAASALAAPLPRLSQGPLGC
jgi:hypothetical protein